jgi:hypothetical protein
MGTLPHVTAGNRVGKTIRNANARAVLSALAWWSAALVLGVPVLLLLLFATQYDARTGAVLIGVLTPFVVLAAFLVRMAYRETRRLLRYRSVSLRLETCPGRVGGTLAGTVEGAPGALHGAMTMRLACWHRHQGDAADNVVWEATTRGAAVHLFAPARVRIPFSFRLPSACEPTGGRDPKVEWMLTVEHPGGARIGAFAVPIVE